MERPIREILIVTPGSAGSAVHWLIAKLLSPSRRPSFAIARIRTHRSHPFSAMCAIKTWRHSIPSQSQPFPLCLERRLPHQWSPLYPWLFTPKIYRISIIAFKALNFPAELIQSRPQLAEIWEGREVYSRLKVFAILGASFASRRKVLWFWKINLELGGVWKEGRCG